MMVVLDTTKVLIFKQITTYIKLCNAHNGCFRYHKGTDFQANHNRSVLRTLRITVVLDTTKVLIFKQITTQRGIDYKGLCCFRYHKGTDFQANHNPSRYMSDPVEVVLDTTKVLIFKQITTHYLVSLISIVLF